MKERTSKATFEDINEAKADLGDLYNAADPRALFRELQRLEYSIPDAARPIFQILIKYLKRKNSGPIRILDLGCSYGVNAALLKYDLKMSDLYQHWGHKLLADASSDELMDYDRRFFDTLAVAEKISVIGFDQAEHAVSYAVKAGLLNKWVVANLEDEIMSKQAEHDLAQVDLITSTGCVGYITEKSFAKLPFATSIGGLPWIANFVLRMFPFNAIEQTLENWGYTTEKLEGQTFIQRRFASREEQNQVIDTLSEQRIDPTGKEYDGYLHAEFYLSRPQRDAEDVPLEQLLVP